MPDRRKHRGPHPEDEQLFTPAVRPRLQQAAVDLCWLLSRGYPQKSALKLVGDRYDLVARQRTAVGRCACSDAELARRKNRQALPPDLIGRSLWLDGYNVLTTVEAALAGGVVLAARDATYRDMASMHGSYRKVAETVPALELIGQVTATLQVDGCFWLLDRPVSNSGRLKGIIDEVATARHWPWQVALEQNPDVVLAKTGDIVATADSAILDHCRLWFNLARETVTRHVPQAQVVEML